MSTPDNSPTAAETIDATETVVFDFEAPDERIVNAAPSESAASSAAPRSGPRTRWAAIVWGLVLAFLAGSALYVLLSPQRRIELTEWVTSLEPTTFALYGALAIGALVLLASLVGLLRRAQRALASRGSSAE